MLVVFTASLSVLNLRIKLLRCTEGQRVVLKKSSYDIKGVQITSTGCVFFKDILTGKVIILILMLIIIINFNTLLQSLINVLESSDRN